jgi:hypothetical protein
MNFRDTKPAWSSQTVQISKCLLNPNYMCWEGLNSSFKGTFFVTTEIFVQDSFREVTYSIQKKNERGKNKSNILNMESVMINERIIALSINHNLPTLK